MSISVVLKVRQMDVGMVDKAVLEALADQVNNDGFGKVCFSEINRVVGLSERGARNIYNRLIKAGFLTIGNKRGSSADITINVEGTGGRSIGLNDKQACPPDRFKNRAEAFAWLQARGQISLGKFYQDCEAGMISVGPDKTVSKFQVMQYAEKTFGSTQRC